MIGESIGPYKILEPLGAGGMGEVYLAEDSRLGRKVAIKVLPTEFASDPVRLARFEQEARAAAALNHPHIAVVHDIGSEPTEDGANRHFMVQEYLEGQSLGARLEKGALPLDKALGLAIEVGEALIAAHKARIVHRDLKPDNIFITEAGHAKVLDFGLAKLIEMTASPGSQGSMSPTMLGTAAGQVMGTAGYMAPEQVNGEEVDHRADVFAFGSVLYETLTARRAFAGRSIPDTLSRILHDEPGPLADVDESLPVELQRIVRKCLAKEPGRRYQTVGDLVVDLRALRAEVESGTALLAGGPEGTAVARSSSGVSWTLFAAGAAVALSTGILVTWWATRPAPQTPPTPVRFEIRLPDGMDFSSRGRHLLSISPDGSRVVFAAERQLWTRMLDDPTLTPIPGTQGVRSPFFSPDGRQLAFQGPEGLMRIDVTGGAPVFIDSIGPIFGAGWADNDTIYVGQGAAGIWRVPSRGGSAEVVVGVDEGQAAHGPQLLPGDEWLLFTLLTGNGDWSKADIVAESLLTGDRVELVESGTDGRWAPTGHLLYVREGTLYAAPLDPRSIGPPSSAVPLVGEISMAGTTGAAQYDFSDNGRLVYVTGGDYSRGASLAWVERDGLVTRLPLEPLDIQSLDLSPDDGRVAVEIEGDDASSDIWVYEVGRSGSGVPLTTDGRSGSPLWSPDNEWVFFASGPVGDSDIWRRRVDRSRDAELVLDMDDPVAPLSITANGGTLLFRTDGDLGILALDRDDAQPEMIVVSPHLETTGDFSPDGRFVAYSSNETGDHQLYVLELETRRSFLVSTATRGGADPHWSQDGSEIYYVSTNSSQILAAEVDVERFAAAEPQEVSTVRRAFASEIDVTADGQRFLAIVRSDTAPAEGNGERIHVVLDWFAELNERMSTGR